MRQAFLVIAAVCYLVFSTGILVSVHICGGEIVDFEFYAAEADGCAGSSCESDGCCKNHTLFFKAKEDAKLWSSIEIPKIQVVYEPIHVDYEIPQTIGKIIAVESTLPIRPPPLYHKKTPLFIKNRVLRL